jgi:uncharacterized protein (TIGR03067 family)
VDNRSEMPTLFWRRFMKPYPWLILAAGLLLAADQPTQDPSKQSAALEGTWSVVAMQFKGKKVPNEVFANTRLVIGPDRIVTMKGKKLVKATGYKLRPRLQPKGIDLFPLTKGTKSQKRWGIYALDGDTLRLCAPDVNAKQSRERPKEFATKPESELILMILKREK